MQILVVNAGSSSLKCKVIEFPSKKVLYSKLVEQVGEGAFDALEIDFTKIDMVGHRVVHGGEKFTDAVVINQDVIETIESLISLAPLHNPANLAGIKLMQGHLANIPHIAVFDTAFHATLQPEAYVYALPYKFYEKEHIRRYGFHGTSHAYLLQEATKKLGKKIEDTNLITLHLGNGESICAIKDGKSVDISMGFTPLEGLMMGTRSGDIDPEIVVYLQKSLGITLDEVDHILNYESGLLGICGENDMRKILDRDDKLAELAVTMMVRKIQKYIGSYLVLLGGKVDALVFSGGIGEHSQIIRDKILDNEMLKDIKSVVIETDEELEIAKECFALTRSAK